MKMRLPTGVSLPNSLRIVRKELAFLEDGTTGKVVPVILSDDDGTSTPENEEIRRYLVNLGYSSVSDDQFELPKLPVNRVPCASVN